MSLLFSAPVSEEGEDEEEDDEEGRNFSAREFRKSLGHVSDSLLN